MIKSTLRILIHPLWLLTKDYYEAKAKWARAKRTQELAEKFFGSTDGVLPPAPSFWEYCPLTKGFVK